MRVYIYIYTHGYFFAQISKNILRFLRTFWYFFVLFGFMVSLRETSFCPLAPKTEKVIENTLPKARHVVFWALQGIPVFDKIVIKIRFWVRFEAALWQHVFFS